jgi:hypothetical protein
MTIFLITGLAGDSHSTLYVPSINAKCKPLAQLVIRLFHIIGMGLGVRDMLMTTRWSNVVNATLTYAMLTEFLFVELIVNRTR